MYIKALNIERIEEKRITTTNGENTVYEVTFRDQRPKKAGGTYCAFRIKGAFWDVVPDFKEGDKVLIQADLVNNYWTDKETQTMKSEPVLKALKVLENFGQIGAEKTGEGIEEEIPF